MTARMVESLNDPEFLAIAVICVLAFFSAGFILLFVRERDKNNDLENSLDNAQKRLAQLLQCGKLGNLHNNIIAWVEKNHIDPDCQCCMTRAVSAYLQAQRMFAKAKPLWLPSTRNFARRESRAALESMGDWLKQLDSYSVASVARASALPPLRAATGADDASGSRGGGRE